MPNKYHNRVGDLSTPITIKKPTVSTDEYGNTEITWTALFNGSPIYCNWVNAHGKDYYSDYAANLNEPATLKMRYIPELDPTCQIFRGSDAAPYRVVWVDNVRECNEWLEVGVERVVNAE